MGKIPRSHELTPMKNKWVVTSFILVLYTISLSACSLFPRNPSEIPGLDQIAIAGTVIALQTQLAVEPQEQAAPVTTATPQSTATLQPTSAPVSTFFPTATQKPAYRAGNVIDVTYLDNATVTAGSSFIKTWRVENTGSQTWGDTFKLVFESGDAMAGPASQPIGKVVAPGQTIDLSVSFIAPATPKTYRGNWMLATDSGTKFGIGASADKPFWVQVVVVTNFAVTAAKTNAPVSYNAACPGVIPLTATLTTTAAGTVTYHYVVNGIDTETLSTTFSEAGTLTTSALDYPVTLTGPLNIQVYIDEPNHQLFPAALSIPVTCTP